METQATPNPSPARRRFSLIIRIGLGTLLALLLLTQMSFTELIGLLAGMNPLDAALATLALIVANAIRAARFRALLPAEATHAAAYRLTGVYNLITALLPAGLGEFYLPYATERTYKVPYAEGLSLLFITRLLDLVAVSLLLVAGAVWAVLATTSGSWTLVALSVVLVVAMVGALAYLDRVAHLSAHIAERLPFLVPLARFARKFSEGFRKIRSQKRGTAVFLTGLQWAFVWVSVYYMLHGLNLPLNVPQVALGMGIVFSLSVLPLSGLANFGIREVGWALVLVLTLGVGHESAVAGAFAIHLVTLGQIVIVWLTGQVLGLLERPAPVIP